MALPLLLKKSSLHCTLKIANTLEYPCQTGLWPLLNLSFFPTIENLCAAPAESKKYKKRFCMVSTIGFRDSDK